VRVAHHDLSDNPDEVLDPASRKVRELRAIAARSAERGLHILLSSEGFRNWKPHHIQALQAIMAPHALRIVYCLRDPATLLYSFWAQQVKTGLTLAFPVFYRKHLRKAATSRIVNPLVEVDVLATIDHASLVLLLYDEIGRQKRDIFDVFIEDILKLPRLPHATDVSGNQRQPVEMTEFMRLVQLRTGNWKDEAEANIGQAFRFLLPAHKEEEVVAAVAAVDEGRRMLPIRRNLPIFTKIERKLLRKHKARMVPRPEANRLFLDGVQECRYYDAAALEADPQVRRLLDEIGGQFRPGGLRQWVLGWSRFWLTLWRRFLKLFRH